MWEIYIFTLCTGTFLYNNYCQALQNISVLTGALHSAMQILNIPSMDTFKSWRLEEMSYLQNIKQEPEIDILHIEYLQTLIKLCDAE
jgi:hypothetical protein